MISQPTPGVRRINRLTHLSLMRGHQPPKAREVEESCSTDTLNVAAWVNPKRAGVDSLSPCPQGKHLNLGIGLLETLWEVVEAIIDTRLGASIRFHNVLHGFRAGMITGKVILEIKLAQDMASFKKYLLFLVFLDLLKVYYTLYWGCLLMTL